MQPNSALEAVEELRRRWHEFVTKECDDLRAKLCPESEPASITYKVPSLADGQDARNKNGLNLTPRGAEIVYRLFDDGAGYNRVAKALSITQAAAKNRKAMWTRLGGMSRQKVALDIDQRV